MITYELVDLSLFHIIFIYKNNVSNVKKCTVMVNIHCAKTACQLNVGLLNFKKFRCQEIPTYGPYV